ncbi:hypothetical protein [Amycolatopsis jejuensis]|nr:hypothetical protein [Amycolatopsis jejuensis]
MPSASAAGTEAHAERADARGWPVLSLATGHEAMVTAPNELAALLLTLT